MDSEQIRDFHLLYNAVYDEDLREQFDEYNNTIYDEDIVEVATEYFYAYGLNEDGIDILIEKVGLDSFVEYVYDLSEDLHVLTEARSAKRRTGGPSYEDVKAAQDAKEKKAAAKKAAKKNVTAAATEKKEVERQEPETRGPESQAKAEQPKSKKPVRDAIARTVFGALKAYETGMARHRSATSTAGHLAKETGKTLGKVVSTTHEAGRRAGEHVKTHGFKSLAKEEVELWVNNLLEEGYDLSEYSWDDMFEIYEEKSKAARPTYMPRSRERNIGKHDDWKDKTPEEWEDKTTEEKKAAKLRSRLNAVVSTQRRQDRETGVREEVELWVNNLLEEGYDLSEYSWDDMFEIYESVKDPEKLLESSGRTPENEKYWKMLVRKYGPDPYSNPQRRIDLDRELGRKDSTPEESPKKKGGKPTTDMRNVQVHEDLYDVILSHLIDEGYAESVEEAEVIMVNMSEEWRDGILEAKIDKELPEYKRSEARLARYDNPSGALALGGGQQRARREEHKERRGKKRG